MERTIVLLFVCSIPHALSLSYGPPTALEKRAFVVLTSACISPWQEKKAPITTRTSLRSALPEMLCIGKEQGSNGENNADMGYEPTRRFDRIFAIAVGIIAAAAPSIANGVWPPLCPAAKIYRPAAWAVARMLAMWITTAYIVSEVRQSRRLVEPLAAAYPDSRFIHAAGLLVHYFQEDPTLPNSVGDGPRPRGPAVVIVHGFGSCAAACRGVMRPLADRVGARVVAFDMPGFGLTERPARSADYDATAVLRGLVDALGLGAGGEGLVVMGHSLGGLVAAAFAALPDSPATALALVAPAIMAPPTATKAAAPAPWTGPAAWLRRGSRVVSAVATCLLRAMLWSLQPLLAALLRRLVYAPSFWRRGLTRFYGRGRQPSDSTLADYRRASRVRGWDSGLARFLRFRVSGGGGGWASLKRAWADVGSASSGMVDRLRESGLPVLIVHGGQDQALPESNSKKLWRVLRGEAGRCYYHVLRQCGHCPLEEEPEAVVEHVVSFLEGLRMQGYSGRGR